MPKKAARQIQAIIKKEVRGIRLKVRRTDLSKLGNLVVGEMKSMISKGISPIRGEGRFPRYKFQGVPGKYPATVKKKFPTKKDRPVNLKLSGKMLKALVFKLKTGARMPTLRIGYFVKQAIVKESGHRDGVNDQPMRATIPIDGKEEFAVRIQRVIDRFLNRVGKAI